MKKRKPRGYWKDIENVRKHAKECKDKRDFCVKYHGGYNTANELGILDELFPENRKPDGYWKDIENVRKHAKECNGISDFKEKYYRGYLSAKNLNILEDLFERKSKPCGYWKDIENIKKHAKECRGLNDFRKKYYGGYSNAKKLGILYKLFAYNDVVNGYKKLPHFVYTYTLYKENKKDIYVYYGITHDLKDRFLKHHQKGLDNSSSVKEKLNDGYIEKNYKVLFENISFEKAYELETLLIRETLNVNGKIKVLNKTKLKVVPRIDIFGKEKNDLINKCISYIKNL